MDVALVKRKHGGPDIQLSVIVRPKASPKLTLMRGVDVEMVVDADDRKAAEEVMARPENEGLMCWGG